MESDPTAFLPEPEMVDRMKVRMGHEAAASESP